jgi:L-ascorbate metabolism protein UlaG (beta-lactamase superfamily)
MELRYLGTATLALRLGDARLVTDPAFDPRGTQYDFGPWYAPRTWFSSEKTYETPPLADEVDAFLVSHDQHADNLDFAGRRLVGSSRAPVVTTRAGARRLARAAPQGRDSRPGEGLGLGDRAHSLSAGASTTVCGVTITATPARHGPRGTPQIDEVIGFLIEAPGQPTIWVSGDTVLHEPLRAALGELRARGKRVDVAVVHCGAVNFPKLPILGKQLFTFDAAQAIAAVGLLDPGLIVPVHRDGWTHFRQPEAELRAAFSAAGLAERTRFLDLGETLTL